MIQEEHYANTVTDMLLDSGMMIEEDVENFKKYLRGW